MGKSYHFFTRLNCCVISGIRKYYHFNTIIYIQVEHSPLLFKAFIFFSCFQQVFLYSYISRCLLRLAQQAIPLQGYSLQGNIHLQLLSLSWCKIYPTHIPRLLFYCLFLLNLFQMNHFVQFPKNIFFCLFVCLGLVLLFDKIDCFKHSGSCVPNVNRIKVMMYEVCWG